MTICIAAICDVLEEPKIVLCTDMKASTPLGSTENSLKQLFLGTRWVCLTAGAQPDVKRLYRILENVLVDAGNNVDETNIVSLAQNAIRTVKKEKVEEYISHRFGITYDEFFLHGKDKLPEAHFRDAFTTITNIPVRASFVIVGFVTEIPILCQVDDDGRVTIQDDFAVVGEGSYLARSALLHREHTELSPINRTLYCTFEAKKYAQRVASVGERTAISVLTRTERKWVSAVGLTQLEIAYRSFGPQALIDNKLVPIDKVLGGSEPMPLGQDG